MGNRAIYSSGETEQTEKFFDGLYAEAKDGESAALDSVKLQAVTSSKDLGELPESVQKLMDSVKDEEQRSRVLDATIVGMDLYRRQHGVMPTADVLDAAIQQGMAAGMDLGKLGIALDGVGTNLHSDNGSAQPNRIVVAITSALAEAIPFATYLPADIQSNEARLGIVSHLAGTTFGGYTQGDLMDGINIGESYLSSSRRTTATLDAERDQATGKVGGLVDLPLLRGRTKVFVNGFPVAEENINVNGAIANSPISGVAVIGGSQFTVSGTVTVATGAFTIDFAPALPVGTVVEVQGFIDYESNTALTPEIISQVQTYSLYANPWRAKVKQSIDSRTQYQNELNLDLQSEGLISIRNQFAMERHFEVLKMAKVLAGNNTHEFDFKYADQGLRKTRAAIWQDFSAVLGIADQQMAEDTMDHGITHLYVTKNVAAQMLALPREVFVPSGLVARPSIYRLGTLFGRFEVYYTPKVLVEGASSSQILCVGRSVQVARCPFVLGDAVPPTNIPLAINDDLKSGTGFYARNFTSVNPHVPSAKGVALINVTNLF